MPIAFPMPLSVRSISIILPTTTEPACPSAVLICHKSGKGSSLISIDFSLKIRPSPDSTFSGITKGIKNLEPNSDSSEVFPPAKRTLFFASFN